MGKLKTTQRMQGNCEEVNTKVMHGNEMSIESSALRNDKRLLLRQIRKVQGLCSSFMMIAML